MKYQRANVGYLLYRICSSFIKEGTPPAPAPPAPPGPPHLIDKLKSLFAYNNHSHSPLNFTGATYESYDGSTSKSIHIPSYSVMQGATQSYSGSSGLVPAQKKGEQD